MAAVEKYEPDYTVQAKDNSEVDAPSSIEIEQGTLQRITKVSSRLTVIVAGLALFSDGYNAQVCCKSVSS